ncbi:cytochrome c553 [Bradyrhizobium sp. i1.7.7]
MRAVRFGILSVTLSLAALAFVRAEAADNAAIQEKAAVCSGCHGENGISQTENIPSLAGQPDQFIQWQLVFFRAGSRKNDQMQPIAEEITNEDIRNFGAYFAQMTPPKAAGKTGIRTCRKKARKSPSAAAAPRAIRIASPAPRRLRGSPASARNTSSRRCTTTRAASASAAVVLRWPMSPIT